MGQMRHKALAPLHLGSDDVDYWANDLLHLGSFWAEPRGLWL